MLPLLLAVSLAAVISQTSQAAAQTPTPLCENGTAVPSPAANPGLVADCSALLTAKDTLRGTATLNWDADTAITAWDGITLAGTPQRVTKLQLTYDRLDGAIPPELGDLEKLEWLYLYGNRLTGTIPAALGSLGELEILYLHYNQLTGSIPPEFGALSSLGWLGLNNNQLSGPIPVELTTLPALQDLYFENNSLTGSIPAGLVDRNLRALYLGGNSGLTGCIPAGLRSVRYKDLDSLSLSYCTTTTTHLLTTTAGTGGRTSPLPGTYRYFDGASVTVTATPNPYYNMGTWGGDCSGTAATCTLTMDAAKTASVSFQIQTYALTVTATGGGSVTPSGTTTQNGGTELTLTASWNDATHSFAGWSGDCSGSETTCALLIDAAKTVTATFAALAADRCATTTAADCIRAVYKGAPGDYAQVQEIPADKLITPGSDGRYQVERGQQITVVTAARLPTGYTRFYLQRRPPGVAGTPDPVSFTQLIKPVGTTYTFTVTSDEAGRTLFTFDLRAAKPPLRPGLKPQLGDRVVTTTFQVTTTTIRYTTYDTTGAATTPGSYAFLTGSGDDETAVTTYEGLRDGTTTGLRIHQSDGYGASQADTYSSVAVGNIFEWREAADCFVRYKVTEVQADPAGTAPRKQLAIEWMTYAFTGCSGAISSTATASLQWGPLPDLGGTTLAVPIRHAQWQIVPTSWTGETEDPQPREGEYTEVLPGRKTTIAEARLLPRWRDPDLPSGWVFLHATSGFSETPFGYQSWWATDEGYLGIIIRGEQAGGTGFIQYATGRYTIGGNRKLGVAEARTIAGRPAIISYSPAGPTNDIDFLIRLRLHDPATDSEYTILTYDRSLGGSNVDAVIAIAESLFDDGDTR